MAATRFAATVSYDGTAFVGSQLQPKGRTVQQELERAFAAHYPHFKPIPYRTNYMEMHSAVLQHEEDHHGKMRWQVGIPPRERKLAERTVRFITSLEPTVDAVPIPPPAVLPGALGELQTLKREYKDTYTLHRGEGEAAYKTLRLVPDQKAKSVDFQIIIKERGEWVNQDDPNEKIANPTFDGTVTSLGSLDVSVTVTLAEGAVTTLTLPALPRRPAFSLRRAGTVSVSAVPQAS